MIANEGNSPSRYQSIAFSWVKPQSIHVTSVFRRQHPLLDAVLLVELAEFKLYCISNAMLYVT